MMWFWICLVWLIGAYLFSCIARMSKRADMKAELMMNRQDRQKIG